MIFDDLKYLFRRKGDDSVEPYRQDITKNKQISERISLFNKNFSETFFKSWVENMILRYIYLCKDKEYENQLKKFESMHLTKDAIVDWQNTLKNYSSYPNKVIKFIDFLDYIHSNETDVIMLKVCLICSKDPIQKVDAVNEEDIYYLDLVVVKENKDSLSLEKQNSYTSNCPCCGAPTNIATFGVCDHCKELISIYDNVWKIRNIA